MMQSLVQSLRETNQRLEFWLDTMVPEHALSAIATPEQIAALLSELVRAGASLREQPTLTAAQDPALDRELTNYRRNVERLRDVLPAIHSRLLGERARLEAQRARVHSAAEWARASRQTL